MVSLVSMVIIVVVLLICLLLMLRKNIFRIIFVVNLVIESILLIIEFVKLLFDC